MTQQGITLRETTIAYRGADSGQKTSNLRISTRDSFATQVTGSQITHGKIPLNIHFRVSLTDIKNNTLRGLCESDKIPDGCSLLLEEVEGGLSIYCTAPNLSKMRKLLLVTDALIRPPVELLAECDQFFRKLDKTPKICFTASLKTTAPTQTLNWDKLIQFLDVPLVVSAAAEMGIDLAEIKKAIRDPSTPQAKAALNSLSNA